MENEYNKKIGNYNNELFQIHVKMDKGIAKINASDLYYKNLNDILRILKNKGIKKIEVHNVSGQRYIGTDLEKNTEIDIHGTPGNDLGIFMNSPNITVYGNVQDGCGNTMNGGTIVVHGHAGDIVGYSMRGGGIFIRDDVGYRVGIHMKEYKNKRPIIVVGGTAQDFLGEYMAGGILVVLGLTLGEDAVHNARFVGTGMHGGKMYIRGKVKNPSRDIEVVSLNDDDREFLCGFVSEFCGYFNFDLDEIMTQQFCKVIPISERPYGKLYAI